MNEMIFLPEVKLIKWLYTILIKQLFHQIGYRLFFFFFN